MEETQEELDIVIVKDLEIINHDYKILIGTMDLLYEIGLFKITIYNSILYISSHSVYSKDTDLSKIIDDIYIEYSNAECNVKIFTRNTDIYRINFCPIYNSKHQCIALFPMKHITYNSINTIINKYFTTKLYLFEKNNNEYVLK